MPGLLDYHASFEHDEMLSLQAILRFRIASALSTGEEAMFAEIAVACNLPERDNKRMLRHATVKINLSRTLPGRCGAQCSFKASCGRHVSVVMRLEMEQL